MLSINAVAESFFATLKTELTDAMNYPTREAAMASITDYLETFYNDARRHSHLDYLSPDANVGGRCCSKSRT